MELIRTDIPCYRILSVAGFFAPNDTLYPLDSIIYYEGEPNEQMEPLNPIAEDKIREHVEKLDKLAMEVAAKLNKPFIGRPRDLEGQLMLARDVELSNRAIMSAPKDSPYIERVYSKDDPAPNAASAAPTITPEKKGRGRPRKDTIVAVA